MLRLRTKLAPVHARHARQEHGFSLVPRASNKRDAKVSGDLYPPMSREQLRRVMMLAHLLGDDFQADERRGNDNEFRRLWSRGWPAQEAWDRTRFGETP